jgi:CheY-like chemotaxis protein
MSAIHAMCKKPALLIVDDNASIRRMIKTLVGDLAGQVYECRDGAEALAAYARHQPDWVLMDIKMNGMDGLTATRKIKADFPEARIVIVTNLNDADFEAAACDAGACGYVVKDNMLELRRILTH